jgi:hypothetical protein
MSAFSISLLSLLTIAILAIADQRIEENLRHVALKDKVQMKIGNLQQVVDFTKLADMDERKVDADLAPFKIERVSDAFISKDGRFVLTFAKDSETKTIKRVLFIYEGGQLHSYADDVLEVGPNEIKTSKGSVAAGDDNLIISN